MLRPLLLTFLVSLDPAIPRKVNIVTLILFHYPGWYRGKSFACLHCPPEMSEKVSRTPLSHTFRASTLHATRITERCLGVADASDETVLSLFFGSTRGGNGGPPDAAGLKGRTVVEADLMFLQFEGMYIVLSERHLDIENSERRKENIYK